MKVFAMSSFYILLLYLQLPVNYVASMLRESDWSRSNDALLGNESRIIPLGGGDDSELQVSKEVADSSLMKTFNEVVKRGNVVKEQYYPILSKVADWMGKKAKTWVSPESVINTVPIVKLAMDSLTSTNGQRSQEADDFGTTINLKNTINHPELIKPLLSQEFTRDIALKSVEVAAGQNVSEAVDEFIDEVTNESTDKLKDGTTGITEDHLFNVFKNSNAMRSLFPEQNSQAAQTMITLLNKFLSTDNVPGQNGVPQQTNESGGLLSRSFSTLSRSFGNAATSYAVSAVVTKAGKILTEKAAFKAIYFFLPLGIPKYVLKFVCILTYLMLVAHQEDVMPKIDSAAVAKINSTTGLEIGSLIDKLNNKELMQKIFPLHDHSNYAVKILKFLAGSEVVMIGEIVRRLKQFKNACGKAELTISDLLKDNAFFNDLLKMPELATLRSLIYGGQQNGVAVDSTCRSDSDDESVRTPTVSSSIFNTTVTDGLKKMAEAIQDSMKNKKDPVLTDEERQLMYLEEMDETTAIRTCEIAAAYAAAAAADEKILSD